LEQETKIIQRILPSTLVIPFLMSREFSRSIVGIRLSSIAET